MEKDNDINKPKKTKWQKTKAFWIPFWCIFNPVSISIIFLLVTAIYAAIDTPNFKNSQRIAKEKLAQLCTDSGYIYDNIEGSSIHMNYTECHYESNLAKTIDTNGRGTFDQFLLYTDDYYFFLSSTSGRNRDYFILKSNHNFSNIEVVDIVGKDIGYITSGYDTHIYYKSNKKYFNLDITNGNKVELDSSSSEVSFIETYGKAYEESLGIEFGDCKRKDNTITFSYFDKSYSLDENLIDSTIYGFMKEAKFEPYYHLSYFTNITTIVYYGYPDPWGGWADCLVIDFDRETNDTLKYQLFNFVDRANFRLCPLIHLF